MDRAASSTAISATTRISTRANGLPRFSAWNSPASEAEKQLRPPAHGAGDVERRTRAARPSSAASLCEQYVSDPAPPKLVDDLAQIYLETGGDISSMLLAMSQHPDFWASPDKVASPIDFAVRSARMARATNPGPVNDLISGSGMAMFDRATPDGYPEDNGYNVNSNALLQRWRFAKALQNDFIGSRPHSRIRGAPSIRGGIPASRSASSISPPCA